MRLSFQIVSICMLFRLISFAQAVGHSPAASADSVKVADKYRIIEVEQLSVAGGVQIPQEDVVRAQARLVKELKDSNIFDTVSDSAAPTDTNVPALRLSGMITYYKKGNRALRTLVSPAGWSGIVAQIVVADRATGKSLDEQEVLGAVIGGLGGLPTTASADVLAKRIGMKIRLLMQRNLARTMAAQEALAGAQGTSPVLDRKIISLTNKNFLEASKQLRQVGMAGFRFSGLTLTFLEAHIHLEKREQMDGRYEYVLLNEENENKLQDDLTATSYEGLRVVPHSLLNLSELGWVVLMEKKTGDVGPSIQYHVALCNLMANALKDTDKFESQGYQLVSDAEYVGLHVLIFERPLKN